MLTVDLIVGACIAGIVAWGIWAGIAVTLPVAAFAAGAVVGALVAPLVLHGGQDSSFALAFALPGALIIGGIAASVAERQTLRLRRRLDRLDRLGTVNAVSGGALAIWIGVVAVWLTGAVVGQVASLRERVEDSTIIGRLDSLLSPPGPGADQRNVPFDRFPIVAGAGPRIESVNLDVVTDPHVRRADRSVVEIAVLGCASAATGGSGWVAADGVVVTNAHVTEASEVITVSLRGTGPARPAIPIWFDSRNDLSLLRVPALRGVAPLPLVRRPRPGSAGATLGFPLGRHAIRAARIGRTSSTIRGVIGNALSQGGLSRGLAGRPNTPFRGRSEPGNSGGPLVDTSGRVLTTVWGGRTDGNGGLGVPNRFVRSALRRAGPAVDTGACPSSSDDSSGR